MAKTKEQIDWRMVHIRGDRGPVLPVPLTQAGIRYPAPPPLIVSAARLIAWAKPVERVA